MRQKMPDGQSVNKTYEVIKEKSSLKVEVTTEKLLGYFDELGLSRISDLHIKTGSPPCYRIDDELIPVEGPNLDESRALELILNLLTEEEIKKVRRGQELDASYQTENCHFRINVFYDNDGVAAAIRALPVEIPEVETIGFPNTVWEDIIRKRHGLVLVTGITGMGKSTTISSLIERINRIQGCRIITLEDPIEYIFKPKRALISQREVGRDTAAFSTGLRALLREDPDIIFVGEMRDAESISWTLTAAETGHLVFSTLHTRDARGSITRIVDSFPPEKREEVSNQLSLGLVYIISQKLLPKKDGTGRVMAMEILNNNYGIANLIRTGKPEQIYTHLQTKTKNIPEEKMLTIERSIADLVVRGLVDQEEALKWVNDRSSFEDEMDRWK